MEDEQVNEVGIEGNVSMVPFATEKVIVHVGSITCRTHFVYAMEEQEGEKDDFVDGKKEQQGLNMSFRPQFGGRGEENQGGEKKPKVSFERSPCNRLVLGVDEPQQWDETDAE